MSESAKTGLDLFPFAVHKWDLGISDDNADCLMTVVPGHKASPQPKLEDVKKGIRRLGFSLNQLINDGQILQYIKEGCGGDKPHTFCLTNDADGEFHIEINSLATEAQLELKKGAGKGSKLDLQKVWAKILSLNIRNFEEERIKKAILNFNASNETETSILLAKGEIPERGRDRELIFDIETLSGDEMDVILKRMTHLKKVPESFQEFPLEMIEKMALVKKGSQIFHLGKNHEGKKGMDIFGNSIPGIDGNDPIVRYYENIIIQEGKALSAIDGILDFSNKDSVYSIRVRKHKDAQVFATVSENYLKASISVIPPEGSGSLPTKETLENALEDKGVVKGISDGSLNSILEMTNREELVNDVTVAQSYIPFKDSKALKLFLDIDPDKNTTIPIEEGDVIAEVFSSSAVDSVGLNVLGDRIFEEEDEMDHDSHMKEEERGKRFIPCGGRKRSLYD